jgi:hypothetical protein
VRETSALTSSRERNRVAKVEAKAEAVSVSDVGQEEGEEEGDAVDIAKYSPRHGDVTNLHGPSSSVSERGCTCDPRVGLKACMLHVALPR